MIFKEEASVSSISFREIYKPYYERKLEANKVEAPDVNSEKVGSIPTQFLLFFFPASPNTN